MTEKMSGASATRSNKKIVVPRVWKRPHSTIYGKNVEFGSKLYSDKLGELDSRKFNTDLPSSWRSAPTSASVASANNGYLSNDENLLRTKYGLQSCGGGDAQSLFARKLATNSKHSDKRIDFFEQLGEFYAQLEKERATNAPSLNNALLTRKSCGENARLDFDAACGVFVPNSSASLATAHFPSGQQQAIKRHIINANNSMSANSSLYGPSADGRKLSLGSINPASYRPSVPSQRATTTAHSSDGEQFEFQDKSSPFYTDRWAGRTIRHFDADLYSNAHLFKTMIL